MRTHLYFANAAAPFSSRYTTLDADDRASSGPETITVSRDPTTGLFAAGEYRYWVHNFGTTPELNVSDARVTVNSGGAQLDSFSVPGGAAGLDVLARRQPDGRRGRQCRPDPGPIVRRRLRDDAIPPAVRSVACTHHQVVPTSRGS